MRRFARSLTVMLCFASPVLVGAPQRAQAQSKAEKTMARQWFDDGVTAANEKRWKDALALFSKASKIQATPQILLAIALCQEKLNQPFDALVTARKALDRARGLPSDKVGAAALIKRAQSTVQHLDTLVARVQVTLAEDYPNVIIKLNGSPINQVALGSFMPIRQGQHTLVTQASGYQTFSRRFEMEVGTTKTIRVRLLPVEPPRRPSSKPSRRADLPSKTTTRVGPSVLPGALLMGVGGAGLALGGIFTAGWQNRVDETCARYENSRCLVLDPSNPQVNDDVNAIGSMRTGATASFVVGGAAFATGTALLIRSLALRSQAESVSVYVSPMGIALRGRF